MTQSEIDKKWFANCIANKQLTKKLLAIKLIVTDIDGSLTDGQLYLSENITSDDKFNGYSKCKNFSIQDGYAIADAIKKQHLAIAFVSGRNDAATSIRAKMLGIPQNMCYIGGAASKDKQTTIQSIQKNSNATKEKTLLFGDDFLDFNASDSAGFIACPQNTPFYFQDAADLVVPKSAGCDAFRLLLDLILYVQEKHFAQSFISASLKKLCN